MRLLTAEDIENEMWSRDEFNTMVGATLVAACQALADSPCPVCTGALYPDGNGGFGRKENCPHCGDFPPDRRGKYAPTWQSACDGLAERV